MNAQKFLEYIQEFRKYDSDIQSQTIAIFIYIAINEGKEGVPMTLIASSLKIAQSSVSRNISILSKLKWNRKIGLNFVENFEDPMNRRSKLVRLTNKGKIFFSKLN